MRDAIIAGAVRTAIGNYGGSLIGLSVSQLGKAVIEEAVKRTGVPVDYIDEVIMGNVLQSGVGQGPARQAAIYAGIPDHVPALTVNKVCGSGLKAVNLAAGMISSGEADIVVAGGMENMSASPYLLENARWGYRMGDDKLVDSMIKDALSDVFNNYHMGITAENLAEKFSISRLEQDEFAAISQQKAEKAIKEGRFKDEIIPVKIPQKKVETVIFEKDEYPRAGVTADNLAKLKPAFKNGGTITAGNSSGINDGAAAVIVIEAQKAKELGIKPMAKIVSYASAGVDPKIMGLGPVYSTKKALDKAKLKIGDIDLIEANEAFAAQSIIVGKELGWNPEKVNVNGGAIALGHPVGASGARILVTLLYEMEKRDAELGLATLCIGGGMGITTIVQKV